MAMPYGAFELKRWYQWNMMSGVVLTVSAVCIIWLGLWLYNLATAEDLTGIQEITVESIMDLGPPPSIAQKPPQVNIEKPKLAQPKVGIPKPVADDKIVEEDVVIATKEELADVNFSDIGLGDGDVKVKVNEEFLPPPDKFVKAEKLPAFINKAAPVYPPLAKQAGISGTVYVKILVDSKGNVRDAIIAKGSGTNAGLEEAALAAAKKCTFSPAIQNGTPIPIWVTFPFEFKLQ